MKPTAIMILWRDQTSHIEHLVLWLRRLVRLTNIATRYSDTSLVVPINPQGAQIDHYLTGRRFDQINFEICDMQREAAHPVTGIRQVVSSAIPRLAQDVSIRITKARNIEG
jgi:hypothetical protein